MKKIFLVLTLTLSFSIISNAQIFRVGIGPAISFPSGSLSDYNGISIGAELTTLLNVTENLEAFGQFGYQKFSGKKFSYGYKSSSVSHLPILVGFHYKMENLMLGAGCGYASYGSNSSGFCFSPQIGYTSYRFAIIGQYNSTSMRGGGHLPYFGILSFYKF